MQALSFVNIHGQPVSLVAPKKAKPKAREREARHDGWLATGISPETLANKPVDMDLLAFVRNAKRSKIRVSPYFSASAAREACVLAERAGWHDCRAHEKKVD